MEHIWEWAKRNPWIAGIAVFGVGLIILWALGYLGGGSSASANQGQQSEAQTQQNLAAAYYAAEAAQATAGTQLQLAQVNDTAAVNIANAQDSAYVAIDSADNTAATSQAGIYAGLGVTEANDQLTGQQAQYSSELAQIQAESAAQQAEYSGYYGAQESLGNAYIDYLNNALPYEFQPTTTTTQVNPTTTQTTTAPTQTPSIDPSFTNVVNIQQPTVQQPVVAGSIDNAAWGDITFAYNPNEFGQTYGSLTPEEQQLLAQQTYSIY